MNAVKEAPTLIVKHFLSGLISQASNVRDGKRNIWVFQWLKRLLFHRGSGKLTQAGPP